MRKLKYYFEHFYPYLFAFVIILLMKQFNICFVKNKNFNDALDGGATVVALIIGFLGAILPVILGMKNESKFVKYVFEKDKKRLFKKYIKATIITGLVSLCLTIIMYFHTDFIKTLDEIMFYAWVYWLVLFLFCTYRSLSNMINLIFSNDSDLENDRYKDNPKEKTETEKHFENKHIFK